jgi:hypothetical protein
MNPEYRAWIAVAFVDQKKDRRYYPNKYAQYSRYLETLSCIKRCQMWCIDGYVENQKYSHCELALPLPNTKREVLAYSVNQSDGVFWMTREFNNPSYDWIILQVSHSQFEKLIDFCDKQLNKKWDAEAARRSVYWPVVNKKRDGNWWCSSFVVAALQEIGYLKYLNAWALDIDDVYNLLSIHDKRNDLAITPCLARKIDSFFSV